MCEKFTLLVSLTLLGFVTGSTRAGPVESAWNPNPTDGAVNVSPNPVLSWAPGAGAALHDVYFGTVFDNVNNASQSSPAYRGRLASTLYDLGELLPNTLYYWRIDEVNEVHPQSPWRGAVWSFRTAEAGRFDAGESANYMKMDSPPDVDKAAHHSAPWPSTCWLATASNVLAGAGYGNGVSVQQRADDIYGNMLTHYAGMLDGGWADTAISWWLSSPHNTWHATNTYNVVTVYGNKEKVPWSNVNGAQYIANELRKCQMVGLSISWPRTAPGGSPYGGHAITAWGDDLGRASLASHPSKVALTDSDRDTNGDVQTYAYDSYTNPNPAGYDEGDGWYIDYSTNHPFIKHIVTLCPTAWGLEYSQLTQKVVGSEKIRQRLPGRFATDLHYRVVTDVPILSYRTTLDVETFTSPVIVESRNRQELTVEWDLSKNPIPFGATVAITTELVLPDWNGFGYEDVHFTYPDWQPFGMPGIFWQIATPRVADTNIPGITGGYVVGSFDLIDPNDQTVVGEYRLLHEYDFQQNPEAHSFTLWSDPNLASPLQAANFRFGHSYGFLDTGSLWEFEDWMTVTPERLPMGSGAAIHLTLNWEGQLPYPQGEIYRGEHEPVIVGPPARNPNPPDQMTGVDLNPVLSWTPGQDTALHDVYFGESSSEVNTASRIDPANVLVSRNQDANTYDPGVLLPNTTYYWRIDELGTDGRTYTGDVWRFTTEATARPIMPVKATASSFKAGSGPERTIDGSGLYASDRHSTSDADMWLSGEKTPQWIQYEFDKVYKLDQMWVWNYNSALESFLGLGAREVKIEHSADGIAWMILADAVEFAQAVGEPTYAHNTTVDFAGVEAKYVKLTIKSNWGGILDGCALSEVRFLTPLDCSSELETLLSRE